jgi:hypothetical protein
MHYQGKIRKQGIMKKLTIIHLFNFLIAAFFANNAAGQIPRDAKLFQGHYYKIYEGSISWTEAKKECFRKKGHLAVIKSPQENQFITTELIANDTGNDNCAWIGGYAKESINLKWIWIDGQSITFYKNFINSSCEKIGFGHQSRIAMIGNRHKKIPIETNSSRYKNWVQTDESGLGYSNCYSSYFGNIFLSNNRYWVCEWDPRNLK